MSGRGTAVSAATHLNALRRHRKDDVHQGSLGAKCADCHTENDWKEAKFDHEKTRFPLTGKHVDTKCVDCHKKGADYKDAPRTCIGCHKEDDDSSKGHKGLYASLLREAARALGGDVPSHLRRSGSTVVRTRRR